MCRIVGYTGNVMPLSRLITEAPHCLLQQAEAPREMKGRQAGDGWGVGWFPNGDRDGPALLKSVLPVWSDENARTALHGIASHSIVAHARLASGGIETCFLNTPLYVFANHLFTMNGALEPWPGALSRTLRSHLHGDDEAKLRGSTDAEMLGALWSTCYRRHGDAARALRECLRQARDLVRTHHGSITANIIIANYTGFIAVRYAENTQLNSLYVLANDGDCEGSLVASETLDESEAWREVPPSTLVRGDENGLRYESLPLDA